MAERCLLSDLFFVSLCTCGQRVPLETRNIYSFRERWGKWSGAASRPRSCPKRCGPEARCQLSKLKMAATDTSCWHLIKDVPVDGKLSRAKELPTRGAEEERMWYYCTITPLRRGCWSINKNTFISLQALPDFWIHTRLLMKKSRYQRNWTRPIWNEEHFPNFLKHREEPVKTIN